MQNTGFWAKERPFVHFKRKEKAVPTGPDFPTHYSCELPLEPLLLLTKAPGGRTYNSLI